MTLSPILSNGVICVGGRLRNAPLPSENINPMIVPHQHHIATLIITYYHQVLGHAGREHVLSVVRQYYWIINARVLIRQILRRCVTCRKRNEAPMQQMMGDLPKARLTPYEPPFTYTGLDFFGPFYVKRGRGTEKVYGLLQYESNPYRRRWITGSRRLHPSLASFYLYLWGNERNME